jgi:hypothetical protein
MATCEPFTVTITGDVQAVLDRVKADVEGRGGTFSGDAGGGSVSGSVPLLGPFSADYAVSGQDVTITVTHRPLLVSCATIEAQARSYLDGLSSTPNG